MARDAARGDRCFAGRACRIVGFVYLAYVYLTLPDVRALATVNPTTTAFMELRKREARGGRTEVRHPPAVGAVHADLQQPPARGARRRGRAFFDHDGIDLKELRASLEMNWEEGRFTRGASTITQQLAKNLYLSPSRNPMRKLKELFITRRLEAALTKRRILEIYLNVIEWGDGIFGARRRRARTSASRPRSSTPDEAALLAGAIINPREHNPAQPTARLLRRQQIISRRMGIRPPASAHRSAVPCRPPQQPNCHSRRTPHPSNSPTNKPPSAPTHRHNPCSLDRVTADRRR